MANGKTMAAEGTAGAGAMIPPPGCFLFIWAVICAAGGICSCCATRLDTGGTTVEADDNTVVIVGAWGGATCFCFAPAVDVAGTTSPPLYIAALICACVWVCTKACACSYT